MGRFEPQNETGGARLQIVLDTNVLIHCKRLENLNWREVEPTAKAFEILIGRTVSKEIDRLKLDGNRRRSQKAKDVSSEFGDLLERPDFAKDILECDPRVSVRLVKPPKIDWGQFPDLDPTYADDRIVAEALGLQENGGNVVVVSNDNGLLVTAKSVGLRFFKVPGDWLLPHESDERDRTIKDQKKELAGYRNAEPSLSVALFYGGEEVNETLLLNLVTAAPLTEEQIEYLAQSALTRYPPTDFQAIQKTFPDLEGNTNAHLIVKGIVTAVMPSDFQLKHYREVEYPGFVRDVRNYFTALSDALVFRAQFKRITAHVENNGRVPAQKLNFEIGTKGDFGICAIHTKPDIAAFPGPPESPLGFLLGIPKLLMNRGRPTVAPQRTRTHTAEPEAFTWRVMPRDRDYVECTQRCEIFRHYSDYDINLLMFPKRIPPRGALNLRATAINVQTPSHKTIAIRVREQTTTILELARAEQLPPEIVALLEQAF